MPALNHQFLEQLTKSQVLAPGRLDQLTQLLTQHSECTAQQAAVLAVKNRFLTRFQAEAILNGRGRTLNVKQYTLVDVLGYGGMGTVYLAVQRDTREKVALKLLGEQFKHDSGMRTRFKLEAKAGMQMEHPRLVQTLELGVVEDLFGETDYMTMELFEGVTLLEGVAFSDGLMKFDAACDVICQAAEGLGYLHSRHMVHRDVKPDNILIDMVGNVKLLDFGLTLAALDDEFSLAMIFGHDCLGTADFIPPEQSIDSFNVDQRADIYSLGCTLFLAISGRRPFPGRSRPDTVKAHRTAPRPRVDTFNPIVPTRLADIVEKMMSINPDDRYQSMEEVIHRLRHFRRRRNWSFSFQQVLALRHQQRRKQTLSKLQAERPTKITGQQETDGGNGPRISGQDEIGQF